MYAGVVSNIGKGSVLSVSTVIGAGKDMLTAIFQAGDASSYKQWLFFGLAVLITLHMSLSPADMKGSVAGTGYIAVLLLIANAVVYYLPLRGFSLYTMTAYIVDIGLTIAGFLTLAVIVAAVVALVGYIVKTVFSFIGK